ncbi:hypothetical protein GE061_019120 [Apolygus lucorum]|uniref:CCHC-type domain-containing protein n=1 Tax=Apolygus lucorum TaxID=248454 RepID=A0A8S9X7L9_APOLU|nr:hypothetical protein GE061_019120 [Apolygus lucorum]
MENINERQIFEEVVRREKRFKRGLSISFITEAQQMKDEVNAIASEFCLRMDALSSKYLKYIDNYKTTSRATVPEDVGLGSSHVLGSSANLEGAWNNLVDVEEEAASEHHPNLHNASLMNIEDKIKDNDKKRGELRLRFRCGDNKLGPDTDYSLWRDRVILELKANDCMFVLDHGEVSSELYTDNEVLRMKNTVMAYIMSNLPEQKQRMVRKSKDPKEMMRTLDKIMEPTTSVMEFALFEQFVNTKFDPAKETVLDFITRFDDLVDKIRRCPDSDLSDAAVKRNLIAAISESCPTIKNNALDKGRNMNVQDIREAMLEEFSMVEEGVRRDQGSGGRAMVGKVYQKAPKRALNNWTDRNSELVKQAKVTCFKCGLQGHVASDCFKSGKMCYNCGSFDGHLSGNCPNSPTDRTKKFRQQYGHGSLPSLRRDFRPRAFPGNKATPAKTRINKQKSENKKMGMRMPLTQALRQARGKAKLAISIDSDTEDLPLEEQMCFVDSMNTSEADVTDQVTANIATERFEHSTLETSYAKGSAMALVDEGSFPCANAKDRCAEHRTEML